MPSRLRVSKITQLSASFVQRSYKVAILTLLIISCSRESQQLEQPPGSTKLGKKSMKTTDYDQAIEALSSPSTWCEGAETLAKFGDRNALVALMQAYELPVEENKICLLDAMDKLDPIAGAQKLSESAVPDECRLALHLMELFPDDSHLKYIKNCLNLPDVAIKSQALNSLRLQNQTPAWEKLMIHLLDHPEEHIRRIAIESLSKRGSQRARLSLENHLHNESSETLRKELESLLE